MGIVEQVYRRLPYQLFNTDHRPTLDIHKKYPSSSGTKKVDKREAEASCDGENLMVDSWFQSDSDHYENNDYVVLMIPRYYRLLCGSGQKTARKPIQRGSLSRNFASALFPLFGAKLVHPPL